MIRVFRIVAVIVVLASGVPRSRAQSPSTASSSQGPLEEAAQLNQVVVRLHGEGKYRPRRGQAGRCRPVPKCRLRSCSTTIVEVKQSAEPLPALDRRIAVGGSHRLLDRYEQPVADTLVVPLAVVMRDIFRHSTPQVALTKGHQLAQALRFY
jgi:hypothetical protein